MGTAENPIGVTADLDERRDLPRCAVDVPATLVVLTHGTMLVGRMTELSLSGCRVLLPKSLSRAAQATIECTFKIRGVGFRLGGLVQWADSNQVGLQFKSMSSRCRDDLAEVLCEVELENNAKLLNQLNSVAAPPTNEYESTLPAIETILAEVAALKPVLPRQNPELWNPFSGMSPDATARNAPCPAPIGPRPPIPCAAARKVPLPTPSPAPIPPPIQVKAAPLSPSAVPAPSSTTQSPSLTNQPAKPLNRGRDRRATQRCGVDTSAIIDLVKVGSKLNGQIIDLSVGGCRIKTTEKFPVGIYTRIETEFKLHGLPFRLGGVIQAIYDRNTVGIRFLDMSERKKDQVGELVAEIGEANAG